MKTTITVNSDDITALVAALNDVIERVAIGVTTATVISEEYDYLLDVTEGEV